MKCLRGQIHSWWLLGAGEGGQGEAACRYGFFFFQGNEMFWSYINMEMPQFCVCTN